MPDPLIASALAARLHAFAPFSKFLVGAAIEDTDGRIHTGCNVENATYGLTLCAERGARFKAISEGGPPPLRPAMAGGCSGPAVRAPPFPPGARGPRLRGIGPPPAPPAGRFSGSFAA